MALSEAENRAQVMMDLLWVTAMELDGASEARVTALTSFQEELHATTGSYVADVEFIVWMGDALRHMRVQDFRPYETRPHVPPMPQTQKGELERAARIRRKWGWEEPEPLSTFHQFLSDAVLFLREHGVVEQEKIESSLLCMALALSHSGRGQKAKAGA